MLKLSQLGNMRDKDSVKRDSERLKLRYELNRDAGKSKPLVSAVFRTFRRELWLQIIGCGIAVCLNFLSPFIILRFVTWI